MRGFTRRLLSFASVNALSHLVGAASGILLVRWMSIEDYAVYAVVITVMGAISVLTKGGVQLGFSSLLGKTWPDLSRASSLIASVRQTRWIVSAFILPVIIASSYLLFDRAGADSRLNIFLCFSLVVFWWADMRSRVVDQVLFFSQGALYVQSIDALISILRVALVLTLGIMGFIGVISATLINIAAAVARVRPILSRIREVLTSIEEPSRYDDRRAIKQIAIRQIPVDIFYVLQAQVAMIILVSTADSSAIAGYGALSRIAQLLSPIQAITLAIFVPLFAVGHVGALRKFGGLVLLASVPGTLLFLLALATPSVVLWPLGPGYSNQISAVIVCAGTAAFNTATSIAWSLAAHRGWNHWGWLRIPFGLFWCLIGPLIVATNTISGAFLFYAGFSIGTLVAVLVELAHAMLRGELTWTGREDDCQDGLA